jgi:hypothetical protein
LFDQTKFECRRCSRRIPSRTERSGVSVSIKIPSREMRTYLFEVLCLSHVCPAANVKVSKETSRNKRGTSQTHSNRRRKYIQCPTWRRTLLRSLFELRFQIYSHPFINVNSLSIYAGPQLNSHLVTLAASLGLSPKLGKDFLTITPLLIFFSSRSHLFMNKIKVVWDSCGEEQIAFQRTNESSRRLMLRSSTSCSSKQEMGARKIMAFTSSKYGLQMD